MAEQQRPEREPAPPPDRSEGEAGPSDRGLVADEVTRLASFPLLNPNPVLEVELDGRTRFINPAARAMFPDLERDGPRHPCLADWPAVVDVCRTSVQHLTTREVAVGGRWYHQSIAYLPQFRCLRVYMLDVTPRRCADEELHRAHELLEAVTNGTGVIVATVDTDLRYTYFNEPYREEIRRLTGTDVKVGDSLVELFAATPEQRARALSEWREPLQGRTTNRALEFGDPSRHRRVYNVLHAPLLDSGGRVVGAGEVAYDITERVLAEETIRFGAAELDAVLAAQEDVVLVYDTNMIVQRANRSFGARHGFDPVGLGVNDIIRRVSCRRLDGAPMVLDAQPTPRALSGEQVSGEAFIVTLGDGTDAVVETSSGPMLVGGGIAGSVTVWHDATARRHAEQALRQANARLDQTVQERTAELARVIEDVKTERQRLYDVLGTLPAYVALLAPDYRVAFANRSFEDRFGQAHGRRCFELHFGRVAPCETCGTFTVLETGAPYHWEWPGPDGRRYDVSAVPFTDIDGTPLILEMGLDITERRRAEDGLTAAHDELTRRAAQLRALAEELTRTEQRERRRLSVMLHDHVQQLLAAAKMRLEVSIPRAPAEPRADLEQVAAMLDESMKALRSLTVELSPPILNDAGLAAGLKWLGRWMKETHGLAIDVELDEAADSIPEGVTLLVYHAVRELLFNIVKHAGVKRAEVRVARDADGWLSVRVADDGVGFDSRELLSGSAHPTDRLGLFSIRERLVHIGGRLDIDTAPGLGARFTLVVPVPDRRAISTRTVPARAAAIERPSAVPEVERHHRRRIGVLLADDHAVMRQGLASLLGAEDDIEVVGQAADGEQAVEKAQSLVPDVILMDVSMPRLNGVQATRIIHARQPDIRIIGLSMFDETDGATAMLEAGAVAYLTKTGESAKLLDAIRGGSRSDAGDAPPAGVFER